MVSDSGGDANEAKARGGPAALRLGGCALQIAWAFKGSGLAGHDALLDRYSDQEFDSPTRSTIPLLEYWRSPKQPMRELTGVLGLPVPSRVQLNFEHTVCPREAGGSHRVRI